MSEGHLSGVPFYPPLWANPSQDPVGPEGHTPYADARLNACKNVQQPFAPDQCAIVLRWDLITWWHDLVRRRAQVEMYRASVTEMRTALEAIATGEGCYGAQALEYKNIARAALGFPNVGASS